MTTAMFRGNRLGLRDLRSQIDLHDHLLRFTGLLSISTAQLFQQLAC